MPHATLLLKDGRQFHGQAIGATGISVGEVVFNTSMTGYQEILTDPSYNGQIVTFTYPLLGNYGTNEIDLESRRPFLRGVVINQCEIDPSNFRSVHGLDEYLREHQIIGIFGVDTRAITKHIRQYGVIPGAIISGEELTDSLLQTVSEQISAFTDKDAIAEVSCKNGYIFESKVESEKSKVAAGSHPEQSEGSRRDHTTLDSSVATLAQNDGARPRIAALDFGMKINILRKLSGYGFEVKVFPYNVSPDEVIAYGPSGLFLSNGPGDPKSIPDSIETIRQLVQYYPTMGICLGHQLLALALGGDTYKLKFGHRGANHPVKHLPTGRITITTQNHGYAVDDQSLAGTGLEVTHINLNDQTVEGMRHTSRPIFCVQYHPEASAGPEDSFYLFEEFRGMMRMGARGNGL